MPTLWITYDWNDNQERDIDFIAQELDNAGLNVELDRWALWAGQTLWEQIGQKIQDPDESDAWLIVATENSLENQKCREELWYALDRTLDSRGEDYPIIGLFPSDIDDELIPPAIKTRLYVSLQDENWVERIVATAQGRPPDISMSPVEPYYIDIERNPGSADDVIEMRPRGGTWSPFIVGIPADEKASVNPRLIIGPSGGAPGAAMTSRFDPSLDPGGDLDPDEWTLLGSHNQATPKNSFYLHCDELPSEIFFGPQEGTWYLFKVR